MLQRLVCIMHSRVVRLATIVMLLFLFVIPSFAERDSIFAKCISAAERIAAQISSIDDRDFAYSKIVLAYARAGNFARAETIADQIDDHRGRTNALLDAENYSNARERNRMAALALLRAAAESAARLSDAHFRDNLYWIIAYRLALNQEAAQALAISRLIKSRENYDQALERIVSALVRNNNDLDTALRTAESISKSGRRDIALGAVARALLHAGKTSDALTVAEQREVQKGPISLPYDDAARAGDYEKAFALARVVENPHGRFNSLNSVARRAFAAGEGEVAGAAWREARRAILQLPHQWHHSRLANLAVDQAKAHLIDDALVTADNLAQVPHHQRVGINGESLIWALGEIAQTQNRVGKLDDARATIERARSILSDAGNTNHVALVQVVRMAVAVGDIDLASEIAAGLPTASSSDYVPEGIRALEAIAVGLAKTGDFDRAAAVVSEIDNIRRRDHVADGVFRQIAIEQTRRGELDAALETAAKILEPKIQVMALAEMATAQNRQP